MSDRMFTGEELASAVVEGNRVMVETIEELCNRIARAEFDRDRAARRCAEIADNWRGDDGVSCSHRIDIAAAIRKEFGL